MLSNPGTTFCVLRALQFILAITVCGLSGHLIFPYEPWSKLIYGVSVGAIAAFTVLAYCIPVVFVRSHVAFVWDLLVAGMYIGVFAAFREFVSGDAYNSYGDELPAAIWLAFVSFLLWLTSAVVGAVLFVREMRNRRSGYTGNAAV